MFVWCIVVFNSVWCTCTRELCLFGVCAHMLSPRVHWNYVCLFGVCAHMLGPRVLLLISVAIVTDSTQTECIVLWINSVGLSDSAPPRTICIFLIEYNNLIKVCIKNYY